MPLDVSAALVVVAAVDVIKSCAVEDFAAVSERPSVLPEGMVVIVADVITIRVLDPPSFADDVTPSRVDDVSVVYPDVIRDVTGGDESFSTPVLDPVLNPVTTAGLDDDKSSPVDEGSPETVL